MLLLALNDHNEAVYLSKLDRWKKPGIHMFGVALWGRWQELSDVSAALVWCGHVSALLVRHAPTRQKRACCRYQSLVLYLLVQRG